jgi:ABC-2 type transport system permease protein
VVYAPSSVLVMVVLGFLGALFVAALGVLVSLRAATVRQAQQTLNAVIIVILLVPFGLAKMLPPEWKAYLPANAIDGARFAILAVVAFALLDAGVTVLAMNRFTRARLIAN